MWGGLCGWYVWLVVVVPLGAFYGGLERVLTVVWVFVGWGCFGGLWVAWNGLAGGEVGLVETLWRN